MILEEYHSKTISVFRFHDSSIPGLIEIWRIHRHAEKIQFFVAAINISQLKKDIALQRKPHATPTNLYSQIFEKCDPQRSIHDTHYWLCGILVEEAGIDSQGRNYRTQRLKKHFCVCGDFQGGAGVYCGDSGNKWIKVFNRQIIKALASNEFREYSHYRRWRDAVMAVDWLDWLVGLSRKHIDPEHILQKTTKR